MYHSKRPGARPRSGFSLVEILIVIAIIAILLALATAGFFRFTNLQYAHNTQSRLATLDALRKEQWNKVVADAKKEDPSEAVITLAGLNMRRARVIWIKVRLAEAFPMSYAEILTTKTSTPWFYQPGLYPNLPPLIPPGRHHYNDTYKRQFPSTATPNNPPLPTEPAACLNIALSAKKAGNAATVLDQSFTADTDNDGIPELVDNWGKPLEFFRFGVGLGMAPPNSDLPNLQSMAPPPTNKKAANFLDPLDPSGTLVDSTWDPNLRKVFEQYFHPVSLTGGPPSYYVAPVIASAGLNGKMALDPTNRNLALDPNDANAQVNAADNLYNFTSTIGGRAP